MSISVILTAGFLIRLPGILSTGFLSDESVYYYAAYAIERGVTPYTLIMLPHPPIGYLFLIPAAVLAQGSLLILRTFNLCTFLVDAFLSYWLFRILRQQSAKSFNPLLAFALFTLYPLPFTTTTPLEFTVFDIPILLGTIFFVKGLTKKSASRLAFSGFLLGIAVMIWFTAAFYAVSIIGFLAIYRSRADTGQFLKIFTKRAAAILMGGSVAIGLVLGLIIAWGALPNFLVQSVGLQTSLRAAFTFGERLNHIVLAMLQLLPVFVLAGVGVYEVSRRVKSGADPLILLPAWVLIANLILVFAIPRIVLNHYVAYLMPFLVIMAAGPVERFAHVIYRMPKRLAKPIPWDIFQSALAIGLIASGVIIFPYQTGFLVNSPYTVADQTVGQYVANITLPGNAIWTSEGSVAYFASRLIQPPNSTQWPFQAEYNDIFNTTYVDSDGIIQRGLGAVSPSQFVNAWQSHNTKVLIFILGNGPVPYPDTLLWDGFSGTPGVMQWVGQNYNLVRIFTFPNVSYQYFVWLKK
ncbi:hypothetical protein E6H34_00360 [Candidatus Bathyarchaeota archaeon]|nr:MAG: hypothetical protein E6H34_00360 [Candidatus Bathyarchaeota archaeon]